MNNNKIVSWNVLHIIHELNYSYELSLTLDKYMNKESERNNDIFNLIGKQLNDNCIVCLQECNGDLYDMLLERLTNYNIFSYKYLREPKIKNTKMLKNPYDNHWEYLVTIVPICINGLQNSIQFYDLGKASLIVTFNNFSIFNVHMPFGNKIIKSLEQINSYLNQNNISNFVIIGDFNTDNEKLNQYIKNLINLPCLIPKINGYTRKIKTMRGKFIEIVGSKLDHIVTSSTIITKNTFIKDMNDTSDHLIIGGYISL